MQLLKDTSAGSMCGIGIFIFMNMLSSPVHSAPMSLVLSSKTKSITRRSTRTRAPTPHTVVQGHDIELECGAGGSSAPLIHWRFNGKHIVQGPLDRLTENVLAPANSEKSANCDYYSKSTFILRNVGIESAGIYTCVAELPGQKATKSYDVSVTAAAADTPELILSRRAVSTAAVEDPRIYLYTDSVYEDEGVSTLLMCRATQGTTKTPPVIRWTINGSEITKLTPGYKIETNGDLKIFRTTVSKHDQAMIKCIATGDSGKVDVKEPFVYLYEPES